MRKQQQIIKSREALFSIWFSLCEEDRRSTQEASTPRLPYSRRLKSCRAFMRCLDKEDTLKTQSLWSHLTASEPFVGIVRPGSTCVGCKCPLAEKAKLLSELNKSSAKDLQPRANLAATEKNVALHVTIYLYSNDDRKEIIVA